MQIFWKSAICVGIATVFASCCRLPALPAGMNAAETSAWTVRLQNSSSGSGQSSTPAVFQATRQIAFGSNHELVIAKDSGPFAKPNRVQGFVLDAETGKVLREVSWTSGSWPFLFATYSGKYAVATENGMALYSQGLERVLATGTDTADKSSPDGRFLSATESIPGHGVTVLIDAESLKPTGTEFRDTYAWSVAENRIASSASRNNKAVVLVEDKSKPPSEYQTDCGGVRPNFIKTDLLAVLGCQKVDVVTVAGARVFIAPLKGSEAFFVASSRDGNRFAVIQSFDSPGDPPLPCAERITVFDVRKRKAIFVTDLSDSKGFTAGGSSGVALSPDGSRLAINSGGVVRLFNLSIQ